MRNLIRISLCGLLGAIALLFIAEGAARLALSLQALRVPGFLNDVRYDPLLGWVSRPNLLFQNYYGSGKDLTTDAAGVRIVASELDATPLTDVRSGTAGVRIVCSGDSFTFGMGVGDADTWCRQLTKIDSNFQTINLGQGGYGIDQSFLRYDREGAERPHDLHILAAIIGDFERVGRNKFEGYQKPFFTLKNGSLVLHNTPVPKSSYVLSWATANQWVIERLALVQCLKSLLPKRPGVSESGEIQSRQESFETSVRLLAALKKKSEMNGAQFVFVFLPTIDNLKKGQAAGFRAMLRRRLAELDIPLIDTTDDFLGMSSSEIASCFLSPYGEYPKARNHYNEKGHWIIAQSIRRHLLPLINSQNTGGIHVADV